MTAALPQSQIYIYIFDDEKPHQSRILRIHPFGSKPWIHDFVRQNRISGNLGEASSGDQTQDVWVYSSSEAPYH